MSQQSSPIRAALQRKIARPRGVTPTALREIVLAPVLRRSHRSRSSAHNVLVEGVQPRATGQHARASATLAFGGPPPDAGTLTLETEPFAAGPVRAGWTSSFYGCIDSNYPRKPQDEVVQLDAPGANAASEALHHREERRRLAHRAGLLPAGAPVDVGGWRQARHFHYAGGMVRKNLDSGAAGELRPTRVPSGQSHTLIVRTMKLDHRYHDEDPVQNAEFTVTFGSGLELKGTLDGQGKATLVGVPGTGVVRYGPDQRPFERVNKEPNPDFRGALTAADFEALRAKYSA